jgi:periplasmic mercuric ion binding protein
MASVPKILCVVLVAAMACAAVSCRRDDIRTRTISIPQMKNERCVQLVTNALNQCEGLFPDKTVVGAGSVTVTYDSMRTAMKNLEHAIAKAGFDANDIPADPQARAALPGACK